jgi:hypothetical protein
MTTQPSNHKKNQALIKFRAPVELKRAIQALADERHIALSALLRLMTVEYINRHKQP